MARLLGISAHRIVALSSGWQVRVGDESAPWIPAKVPGTAAGALRDAGLWKPYDERDFDEVACVWRCTFPGDRGAPGTRVLCFDGIATLAEVWLNGALILSSQSMFQEHEVDVSALLRGENELEIRIAPLGPELRKKRPRPRWKTNFLRVQQIRWFRTAAMGRVPSWPVPAPVGPWREVRLEERSGFAVSHSKVQVALDGADGRVEVELRLRMLAGVTAPVSARLQVGASSQELALETAGSETTVRGALSLPSVEPWWPATHGTPALHDARIAIGDIQLDLGRIGFRRVAADRRDRGFRLSVNSVPIFCRGACWTPLDVDTLGGDPDDYRRTLTALRDAGMNMVRLSGAFVYELPLFHALCDELGLLVWQDFMFMALDYPDIDPDFVARAAAEVSQVTRSLELHPSLSVLCGGSDSMQQPAFLGLDGALTQSPLFQDALLAVCEQAAPGIPYVENSPSGSAPAFRVDQGVSHYFGVGAYGRDLHDVRRSNVRFASESLGFANVPEPKVIDEWLGTGVPVSHPRWKQAVPRDNGAAWDFDDTRDGYFERFYGIDPREIRARDPDRYLALSRVLSGELMEAVMSEWRGGGTCAGGLIWLSRDFRPGPGWGILDATGGTKAAYWLVRRALQPTAVLLSDEGLNGMRVVIANDRPSHLQGEVEIALYRDEKEMAAGRLPIVVAPRSTAGLRAHDCLNRFLDISYAYRFGPLQHDMVVATLLDASGAVLSDAVQFPGGPARILAAGTLLDLSVRWSAADEGFLVTLRARRFAYAVALEVPPPFAPRDNYFHVVPGRERVVVIAANGGGILRGIARPLNGAPVLFTGEVPQS